MAGRLFGTDGVRGIANRELTAPLATRLAMAAAVRAAESGATVRGTPPATGLSGTRPFAIIGRDTRISGDMLESAVAAGLSAMGIDALCVGVVPTPAVARLVLTRGAALGVVISASHNPFEDNGIKFFGHNGRKLADAEEDRIEAAMRTIEGATAPECGDIGRIVASREPVADYLAGVEATLGEAARPLDGLMVVVDCANGAASELAPRILREAGAEVVTLHADPDGLNINVDCGSTHTASMRRAVVEHGAHAGLAFDGDADRVMLADETGAEVDGDAVMAVLALRMHAAGRLPGDVVVATVMSNVGLERALEASAIRLHRTDVGDRYVAEGMDALGAGIGGEQSGHILLPHLTPAGDGIVTGLQVLGAMAETGRPLSELAGVVVREPQRLEKVRVADKAGWQQDPEIARVIAEQRSRLEKPDWLNVRASGTEPVIRVMAQGAPQTTIDEIVASVCSVIRARLETAPPA